MIPAGVGVDLIDGRLHWIKFDANEKGSVSLDGNNFQVEVIYPPMENYARFLASRGLTP